jgi:hypothetical protein
MFRKFMLWAGVVGIMGFVLMLLTPFKPSLAQVTQEWVARYNGPLNGSDNAFALVVDGEHIYVTGASTGSGTSNDFATLKYDASGNQLWLARYDGPGNSGDGAYALAVDGGGNVYVTGYSSGSGTFHDYATIKYDASGNQLWAARYNGPGNYTDEANSVAVDGVGNVYVTGKSCSGGSYSTSDYATIKYDASGNQLWVARYNGPGNNEDGAYLLAVDDGGNSYVTGYSSGSGSSWDFATVKYDASGNQLWVARYNGPGNGDDVAYFLAADGGGNVCVTGYSQGSGTNQDYATIKYDTDGSQIWLARYDGPGSGADRANSLTLDGAGNVYVTGLSIGSENSYDYATLKYNSSGDQIWVARYNAPVNSIDEALSLAMGGGGSVYVTGYSYGSGTDADYATVKYDASGNEIWVMRYNGPGNSADYAHSLAVDGGNNVYITGASTGSGTDLDYVTIKYNQNPPLTVEISPASPPIIIPVEGGDFDYNATVANSSDSIQTTQGWIMVQLPSFVWYGPALGPISLTLPGGASITRLRTQTVPASAPAGLYTYRAYLGSYPATMIDSSSFIFTKLGSNRDWLGAEGWICSGEPIGEEEDLGLMNQAPTDFALLGVSPNPFNPATVIAFDLSRAGWVKLEVFDVAGRAVGAGWKPGTTTTLINGWREAGAHEVTFDGSGLAAGIYFAKLTAASGSGATPTIGVEKMVLLK